MSKKIAEGIDALVLDVKVGRGAFMADAEKGRRLAQSLVRLGTAAGVRTEALITAMDVPLGLTAGNALEVVECLETLKGRGPDDLWQIVQHLAATVLTLAGVAASEDAAHRTVTEARASGRALEKLRHMIEQQGGNPRVVDDYSLLPSAPERMALTSDRGGYVTRIRAGDIGVASNLLGAGRTRVDAPIDHGVGILVHARCGERVARGDVLMELCHRGAGVEEALGVCRQAVVIGSAPPEARPTILGKVR